MVPPRGAVGSMSVMSSSATTPPDTRFFGQPRSLATLFSVELWERFSFYGMQGILLFYLYFSVADGGLGIDQTTAAGIVGAYGGGVYLSTVLGAWVADRLLDSRRVLLVSAVVVMAGHVALAVSPVSRASRRPVMIGLGSGGLKATATTLVGTLYGPGDLRRDAGFSLYYLGINLGAFLGPILTGLLQSTVGFHWGFGLAAVGMARGLVQYAFGLKNLPDEARVVPNPLPRRPAARRRDRRARRARRIVAAVSLGLVTATNLALVVIVVTALAAIAYFVVILSSRGISSDERAASSRSSPCSSRAPCSGRSTSSSSPSSRSTRPSGSTGSCSAGSSRSRGCSRSTRSSSSCCPGCSPRCGRGWATASPRRR